MANKKLIVVKSNKAIKELNGILGPIRQPMELSTARIKRMIVNEKLNVYECNPNNPLNDQTKLTKENYDKTIYKRTTPAKNVTTVKKANKTSLAESRVNGGNPGVKSIKVSASDF